MNDPKFLGLKNEKRLLKITPHLRKHTGHAQKKYVGFSPTTIHQLPSSQPSPNHQNHQTTRPEEECWNNFWALCVMELQDSSVPNNEKKTGEASEKKKKTFHESILVVSLGIPLFTW